MRGFNQPEREPMTDERMALAALLEKGSDSDLLREMIGYVAQRLISEMAATPGPSRALR